MVNPAKPPESEKKQMPKLEFRTSYTQKKEIKEKKTGVKYANSSKNETQTFVKCKEERMFRDPHQTKVEIISDGMQK